MGNLMLWIYIINFLILIIMVCFERRDPVVSLAWVLGFTVVPVVGFIVFLIFGSGLKKKTANKYLEKWRMNLDLTEKMDKNIARYNLRNSADNPDSELILYLMNTNNSVLTINNDVKIYTEAQEKYKDLLEDIHNAKESINMLYFIIRNDDISKKIIAALTEKAKQGVEVRFLYDSFGCLLTHKSIFNKLRQAGGKVSPFFPVKLTSYSKLNHRNHRKIVVIDGKVGYMGGINIGDEYMGKKKPSPWRDTHIRIKGDAVIYLQKVFSLDWLFSTDEDLSDNLNKYFPRQFDISGDKKIQIAASGPDSQEEEVKCGMIKMLNMAKDTVFIQTPYFVPDQPFLTALKMAAQTGKDIRLMIPGIPDKKSVYNTTYSFIGELLDAGIRVFKYPGFIHSKTMVMDEKISTIGTTNMDIRSFQLHFEVNAFIYDEKTAAECKRIFLKDQSICEEIFIEDYKKRGIRQQIREGFFRLFSPIM